MRDSDHHMQCSTAWTVAYSIVNIKFANNEAPQVGSIVAAWQSESDVWPGPDCSEKASKGPKIRWNIFVTLHESHISSLAALGRALSYMTQVIIYNLREKVKLQIISSAECLLTSCIISVWTLGPLVIKPLHWQTHRDKQERKERNADRESSHQWTFSFKRELADSITGTQFKKTQQTTTKKQKERPTWSSNTSFLYSWHYLAAAQRSFSSDTCIRNKCTPQLFLENLLVCSVKSNNGINAQLSVLPNIKTTLVGFQKGDFFKGKQEAEVEKKAANTGPGAKYFAK